MGNVAQVLKGRWGREVLDREDRGRNERGGRR